MGKAAGSPTTPNATVRPTRPFHLTEGAALSTQPLPQSRHAIIDRLHVHAYDAAAEAGEAAAVEVSGALRRRLAQPGNARVVFAAAPSQDTVLHALSQQPGIDWSRVTAFQMDEYIGLRDGHPQRFATYLDNHIFSVVRPGQVHTMQPDGDGAAEAARYAALLAVGRIDVVCLGIGENGHIAFNDPGVADFNDPALAKVVELDDVSRQQQVNDGCFPSLAAVPATAITLTVPALLSGAKLVASVSGQRKSFAVRRALTGPIDATSPASALRRHDDAWLFLDQAAAPVDLLTFP